MGETIMASNGSRTLPHLASPYPYKGDEFFSRVIPQQSQEKLGSTHGKPGAAEKENERMTG